MRRTIGKDMENLVMVVAPFENNNSPAEEEERFVAGQKRKSLIYFPGKLLSVINIINCHFLSPSVPYTLWGTT